MISVMFICLGNICRSPMAEFIFKDMVTKQGLRDKFYISSSATSNEEAGNKVHYGARQKLMSVGINPDGKYAVQLKKSDYEKYDYLICMESRNIKSAVRITGNDKDNKLKRLLDFSNNPRDIADPWYTGNFDVTYSDIVEGLNAFLLYLKQKKEI